MQHLFVLLAVLLPCLADAGELWLTLHGDRLEGKTLHVALHTSAADFPMRDDKALRRTVLAIGDTTELKISDIPAGEYAVAVYADMNGSGKLDSNFIGIPNEPTGASRDAASHYGPPKFKDAVFAIGDGTTMQTIHIK
ncbi:MAG: DUF2141 domain-containing protein [Sideroxydans sp.]|nr:DUF2141 domain-containing protein [Sideroxydans sp.]